MQLTIAIPTYNRSKFLEKNLNSLLKQDNKDFNVLIQDNNSTDNTENIVKKFKDLGLKIDYKKNDSNLGWEKNFELCFKRVNTSHMILLGDDDIIINDGIEIIYDDIKKFDPDLMYCKTFSFSKNSRTVFKAKNLATSKHNLESFLKKTILGFRLISSYVIKTKYIRLVSEFSGNFAHLHVILKILQGGGVFIINNKEVVGTLKNNSTFDYKVNFSDIYVKEFFLIYRRYLEKTISSEIMKDIENIMLKKYYPKLIIKSKLGLIKKDDSIIKNFDLIFSKNIFYNKNRSIFIGESLINKIFLVFFMIKYQIIE